MINLNVALHLNPRGQGFWKLNTSLLSELRYVQEIKTEIESTVNQYKDDTSVNRALLWEMIKLKVKEKSYLHISLFEKQAYLIPTISKRKTIIFRTSTT